MQTNVSNAIETIKEGISTMTTKLESIEGLVSEGDAEQEIAELKSALNHVSMLAKVAHDATVEERKQHAAEINRLQGLLNQQKK